MNRKMRTATSRHSKKYKILLPALALLFFIILIFPILKLSGSLRLNDRIVSATAHLEPLSPQLYAIVRKVAPGFAPPPRASLLDLRQDILTLENLVGVQNLDWNTERFAQEIQNSHPSEVKSEIKSDEIENQAPEASQSPKILERLTGALSTPNRLDLNKHRISFTKLPNTAKNGIWLVTLTSNQQPTESISFKAIPLEPGQSIILTSTNFTDPSRFKGMPSDSSKLRLKVISLGATPDRLDAPGKLMMSQADAAKDSVPPNATSPQREQASTTPDSPRPEANSENLELTAELTTPISPEVSSQTEPAEPAFVEISHVPVAQDVFPFKSLPPEAVQDAFKTGVRLTWSQESSGVALILGSLDQQNEYEPNDTQIVSPSRSLKNFTTHEKGLLFLSIDELNFDKPTLPLTKKAIESLGGHQDVLTFHEVWPGSDDAEKNQSSLLGSFKNETQNDDAQTKIFKLNDALQRMTSKKKLAVRVNILFDTEDEKNQMADGPAHQESEEFTPSQEVALTEAQFLVTLRANPYGEIDQDSLARIASMVASGYYVHVHLHWGDKPRTGYSIATLLNLFSDWRWEEIRALTILSKPKDLENVNQRVIFEEADSTIATLITGLTQKQTEKPFTAASVLVHVARQATPTKRSHAQLTDQIPAEFAPGYASYFSVSSVLSHYANSAADIEAATLQHQDPGPISQAELMQWVARSESNANTDSVQDHNWYANLNSKEKLKALRSSSTQAQIQRGSAALSQLNLSGRAGTVENQKSLNLIAETSGQEGSLFIFDEGWAFIPIHHQDIKHENVLKSQPIFGVPLERIIEAKARIFDALSRDDSVRISILIPAPEAQSVGVENSPQLVNNFVDSPATHQPTHQPIYRIELRSEFPVTGCSSSLKNARFERSFGQSDGSMQIVHESALELNKDTEISCVVELGHKNPIPKRRAETLERAESSQLARKKADPVVTMSVRVSVDGKRVPLTNMKLGPYLEPAEDFASTSGAIQFDLLNDYRGLICLTPLSKSDREMLWGTNASSQNSLSDDPKVTIWFYPSSQLIESHPSRELWNIEISQFLSSRQKLAEKMRNAKF